MRVDPDVDSFILQTLDPPVEGVQRLGVQVARVFELSIEDIGVYPVRVVMVDAHQVVAELGHAVRLLGDVLPRGGYRAEAARFGAQKRTGVPSSKTK